LRRICEGDRFVRAGRWPAASLRLRAGLPAKDLHSRDGRVGRAIAGARKLSACGSVYTDLRPVENVSYRFVPDLIELARDVDVLVTRIGRRRIAKPRKRRGAERLGPEGLLINVARGSVVDEEALVAALAKDGLGGAGLDVFADEPRVPQALWTMEQVVLQPHRASATLETRADMGDVLVANLTAHFAGQSPLPRSHN